MAEIKILNPIKPAEDKLVRECEISYEDGKFYIQSVDARQIAVGDRKEIQPPCDLISYKTNPPYDFDREEISVVHTQNQTLAFRREISQEQIASDPERYTALTGQWTPGVVHAARDAKAYDWHDKRRQHLSLPDYNQQDRNFGFDVGNELTRAQKTTIFNSSNTAIDYFKQSCSSSKEYAAGINYLISGGQVPQFSLTKTDEAFKELQNMLTHSSLLKMENNSRKWASEGNVNHLATLGETRQFVLMLLQHSLTKTDSTHQTVEIPLDETGDWGRLSPTSAESDYVNRENVHAQTLYEMRQEEYQENLRIYQDNLNAGIPVGNRPIAPVESATLASPEDLPPSGELRDFLRTNFRAISEVQKPLTLEVQVSTGNDDEKQLAVQKLRAALQATKAIYDKIKDSHITKPEQNFNQGDAKHIAGFLFHLVSEELAKSASQSGALGQILLPLKKAIETKLHELDPTYQIESVPDVPAPPQAIPPGNVPAPQPPAPPGGLEADHSLTGPGMRGALNRWLESNKRDHVSESADKKTLIGSFENDIEFVVHSNKMVFRKASGEELTDEELRTSIKNMVQILRQAQEGNPNIGPLCPIGNDHQKEVIRDELLKLGVKIKEEPEPPATNADENQQPTRGPNNVQ